MVRYDLESILKPNLLVLRCVGLWPPNGTLGKSKLFTFYSILTMFFCVTLHTVSQTIILAFLYDDLPMLATATYFLLEEWVALVKIFYFFNNFADIKRLMAISREDLFQPKNKEQEQMLQREVIYWGIGSAVFLFFVLPTVFLWFFVPILDKTTSKFTLPFTAWYPFNYKCSPVYEITYIYQVIACFLLSMTNVNLDIFGGGLLAYLAGQCDLLADDLRNLGHSDELTNAVQELEGGPWSNEKHDVFPENTAEIFTLYVNDVEANLECKRKTKFQNDLHLQLKVCIRRHKLILEYTEGVSRFFKLNAFGQFTSSCIATTMTLFQLSVITFGTAEFYMLLVYQIAVFLQLIMYCWYGNEVIEKSSKISYAAFESNWIHGSEIFKRDLMYFILRSQKVIKISAVDLFELSLQVYVTILRTSFSYFAVLKQVYHDG